MFTFKAEQWVPQFILNDKNGYALAKAIEAAVQYMNDKVQQGFDCLTNVDKMPEWRLDELAWETKCPYDYAADVEIKRKWIRDAEKLYRLYGTAQGVIRYMTPYFDGATLEENWQYGGEAFHFRMAFPGGWTPEKVAWATKAIDEVKNLRSVLDRYRFLAEWPHSLYAGTAFYATDKGTYRISKENVAELDYYADEDGDMLLDENGMPLIVEE